MSFELLLASAALALCAGTVVPAPPAPPTATRVFLTVDEALKLAFPDCAVERGTAFLDEEHRKRVAELSRAEFDSGVVFSYVATRAGELVGTAYFDTHRVRTLRETLMFVVGTRGEIRRVEILAFAEPLEYVPREGWYGQFLGRVLDDELNLRRAIRPVTGATLTARATTDAARRTLALHQVLAEIRAEEERRRREEEERARTHSEVERAPAGMRVAKAALVGRARP